eukprot:TRINITY_DN575_c0_g1_i1.p1 TRINITY_DN575_c0_g1~~TRINITY_DN575_c0_g1_i1.p1  ORF type:complete len:737 (+),score=82.87 TRINITY_DN575_c0_g1_i1:1257-3467(+)
MGRLWIIYGYGDWQGILATSCTTTEHNFHEMQLLSLPPIAKVSEILFRGVSLEKLQDVYVVEYGLNENDVIFVEHRTEDGWVFALNYNEPKYFASGSLKHPGAISDEPSYRKYWENAFSRPFPPLDTLSVLPEYGRLQKALHILAPKVEQKQPNNGSATSSGGTSCSGCSELECNEVLKIVRTPVDTPEKHNETVEEDKKLPEQYKKPMEIKEESKSVPAEGQKMAVAVPKVKAARPSGIKNIGNSCYISSSIQCLKHTKLLWEFIESYNGRDTVDSSPTLPQDGEISKSFSELVQSLKDDNQSIAPHRFKKVIAAHSAQFSGTDQSDAHEFLTFLIDKLHEELKEKETGESRIEDIFYGAFSSNIQCTHCGYKSVSKEPFMCISLPIEGNIDCINIILYTQSGHLLIVNFKYDDETIAVQAMKEEIQRQVIVGPLDIFLLIDNSTLVPVADDQTIGDITRCKSSWQLYAVERLVVSRDYLVKIDINKHSPSFLISCSLEQQDHVYALKETIRKFFIGNSGNDIDGTASRSIVQSLDFNIMDSKVIRDGAMEYINLELKATIKSSELKQLWAKLPQKQIGAIKYKTEENFGTLHGCLNRFTGTEKLQGNNRWMCPSCKSFKDANKSIGYHKLPKVLIIHLKRFKVLGKKSRTKISTLVKFPLILLLTTTDQVTHMYSLYAMMNHIGEIERGHYTAYCRNLKNRNEWLEFDDNKVKPIDASQLETDKAYVLFYEHTQ